MMLIQVEIFQNIAIGGMIVVAMAVLASVTLLPSVLIALGDRIDKWQLLKEKPAEANGWRKFANAVIKRPVMITIVAFILLRHRNDSSEKYGFDNSSNRFIAEVV